MTSSTAPQESPQAGISCRQLAANIEAMQPEASPQDVARLCLLLSNSVEQLDQLDQQDVLTEAWQDMGLRLQSVTDQHAAMTDELETLASSDPEEFSPDQIWVLIRAIKVQSQILQMYVGHPVMDV